MPYEDLTTEDISILNVALPYFPQLCRLITAIKHVSSQAEYPINDFGHLTELLGGPDQTVDFLPATYRVEDFRRSIPAYYFPIAGVANDHVAAFDDCSMGHGRLSIL